MLISGERALLTQEGVSANALRQELLAVLRASKQWILVGDEMRKVMGAELCSALETSVTPVGLTLTEDNQCIFSKNHCLHAEKKLEGPGCRRGNGWEVIAGKR